MQHEITDQRGDTLRVHGGVTDTNVWVSGSIGGDQKFRAEFDLTPAQAKDLASALIRAADEAESGTSEEARLRLELANVDDALRKAGISYPLGARGVRDLARLYESAQERD